MNTLGGSRVENRGTLKYKVMFVILAALVGTRELTKYYSANMLAFDFGIFLQSISTFVNREGFFYNTVEWEFFNTTTTFGVHYSPALLVFTLAYKLWQHPLSLLVSQYLFFLAGVFALVHLARVKTGSEKLAYIYGITALLGPGITSFIWYDFHPLVFALPFMMIFPLLYEKKKIFALALVSVAILSVREDAGLFLIAIGTYYFLRENSIKGAIKKVFRRNLSDEEKLAVAVVLAGVFYSVLAVHEIEYFGWKYGQLDYTLLSPETWTKYSLKLISIKLTKNILTIAAMGVTSLLVFSRFRARYLIPIIIASPPFLLVIKYGTFFTGYPYYYIAGALMYIISIDNMDPAIINTKARQAMVLLTTVVLIFSPMVTIFPLTGPNTGLRYFYATPLNLQLWTLPKEMKENYSGVYERAEEIINLLGEDTKIGTDVVLFAFVAKHRNIYAPVKTGVDYVLIGFPAYYVFGVRDHPIEFGEVFPAVFYIPKNATIIILYDRDSLAGKAVYAWYLEHYPNIKEYRILFYDEFMETQKIEKEKH